MDPFDIPYNAILYSDTTQVSLLHYTSEATTAYRVYEEECIGDVYCHPADNLLTGLHCTYDYILHKVLVQSIDQRYSYLKEGFGF